MKRNSKIDSDNCRMTGTRVLLYYYRYNGVMNKELKLIPTIVSFGCY